MSPHTTQQFVPTFSSSCPCDDCRTTVERRSQTCHEHGRIRCVECYIAGRSLTEILWRGRFMLKDIVDQAVRLRGWMASVLKFALVCPCHRCSEWRMRLLDGQVTP